MKNTKQIFVLVLTLWHIHLYAPPLSEHITDGDLLFATKEKDRLKTDKINISSDSTNVIDLISKNPEFSKFAEFIRATGLTDPLKNEDNITLFIPNNSAFTDKVINDLESLQKENKTDQLKEIVLNHVFSERIPIAKLSNRKIENLNGKSILTQVKSSHQQDEATNANKSFSTMVASNDVQNVLMVTEKKIKDSKTTATTEYYIGSAKIIDSDINGKNGIIHEINAVLK